MVSSTHNQSASRWRFYIAFTLALSSSTATLHAQQALAGVVLDAETSEPIAGANILIVGSNEGTITDSRGEFAITTRRLFPLNIKVSHIAYAELELSIIDSSRVIISLHSATLAGEEIVVTGERSRADSDLSSSVVLISAADIALSGISDLTEVFAPLASIRVEVTPYGKQTINIRGSNANEVPVYLDGIKLNDAYSGEADLSLVDMTDITEIEIVKGGSVALFGPGALGGAVSLTTTRPEKNRLSFSRGIGITDENDQDLSLGADVRIGPAAFGGRFTGKSRLYNGETLFTNLQSIFSASFYPTDGILSAKLYQRGKFIEYASGETAQADSTTLLGISYRGAILGSRHWDISFGQRTWSWNDNFLQSLERELLDSNRLSRVSKSISIGLVEATLQTEYEEQHFAGRNKFLTRAGSLSEIWDGEVNRINRGYASIIKVLTPVDHPNIEHVKWEFAIRRDYTTTDVNFSIDIPNSFNGGSDLLTSSRSTLREDRRTSIIRLGFAFEGGGDGFTYEFYANQGSNQRLPTLRDMYLYQATPNYVRGDLLLPEYYSSSDIGVTYHRDNPRGRNVVAWMETSLELFTNSYLQKIAHRSIFGSQLLPFNRQNAQIHGFEATLRFASPKQHYITSTGVQFITVSDPTVFPNKPLARFTFQIEAHHSWGIVRIDNLWEGPQYIVLDSFLDINAHDRKNTNLSVIVNHQIGIVKGSLVLNMRNLLNFKPAVEDEEALAALPYEYFERRRNLLSLRIEL